MEEWLVWFRELVSKLHDMPIVQGALAGLCTFIFEDPTTIGSGLLVADGKMTFWTAFIGLSVGISLGDFGLYLMGRYFHRYVVAWGWITEESLKHAEAWFENNMISGMITSRIVPGMRVPAFIFVGIVQAPMVKFLTLAVVLSVIWTLALLTITIKLGRAMMPFFGEFKWPLALAALLIVALVHFYNSHRWRRHRANNRKLQADSANNNS